LSKRNSQALITPPTKLDDVHGDAADGFVASPPIEDEQGRPRGQR
jgi:hypothetical protein